MTLLRKHSADVYYIVFSKCYPFFGAYTKFREGTIRFVMFLHTFFCPHGTTVHTARIFVRSDVCLFENMRGKLIFD
jgi:hypothetical protein